MPRARRRKIGAESKPVPQDPSAGSKRRMVDAMRNHLSVVTYAAKEAGIQARSHYNWMRDDDNYRKDILELRQERVDFAVRKMLELVDEKDYRAIDKVARCNGGFDGWRDDVNVSVSGSISHDHNVMINELSKQVDMPALERAVEMLAQKKKKQGATVIDAEVVNA